MSEVRERFRRLLPESATPAQTLQAMAKAKAEVISEMWESYPGKNLRGAASFSTRRGAVSVGQIRHRPARNAQELDSVEVWLGGSAKGAPAWRIVNPPTLVSDPAGDVLITDRSPNGRNIVHRYREDPLVALAEFIATNQGRSEGS
jgi:hypothetical protein